MSFSYSRCCQCNAMLAISDTCCFCHHAECRNCLSTTLADAPAPNYFDQAALTPPPSSPTLGFSSAFGSSYGSLYDNDAPPSTAPRRMSSVSLSLSPKKSTERRDRELREKALREKERRDRETAARVQNKNAAA